MTKFCLCLGGGVEKCNTHGPCSLGHHQVRCSKLKHKKWWPGTYNWVMSWFKVDHTRSSAPQCFLFLQLQESRKIKSKASPILQDGNGWIPGLTKYDYKAPCLNTGIPDSNSHSLMKLIGWTWPNCYTQFHWMGSSVYEEWSEGDSAPSPQMRWSRPAVSGWETAKEDHMYPTQVMVKTFK